MQPSSFLHPALPCFVPWQAAGDQDGHTFIAAAGNDLVNLDWEPYKGFPAAYAINNIVSVAATDRADALSLWGNGTKGSNYGQ